MYKVSILGKANTGKDTLSRMIIKQLRIHARETRNIYVYSNRLAFATPIKEMIRQMYPDVPKKHLYGASHFRDEIIPGAFKNGQPLTIRQLLIDLGTAGREYNPNIWIDNLDSRLTKIYNQGVLVVTDVRFRNEFEFLRKKGFYQIRLYRNNNNKTDINHISEFGQDSIKDDELDYVLFNNRGLKDLRFEVTNNIIPQLRDI